MREGSSEPGRGECCFVVEKTFRTRPKKGRGKIHPAAFNLFFAALYLKPWALATPSRRGRSPDCLGGGEQAARARWGAQARGGRLGLASRDGMAAVERRPDMATSVSDESNSEGMPEQTSSRPSLAAQAKEAPFRERDRIPAVELGGKIAKAWAQSIDMDRHPKPWPRNSRATQ